MAVSWRDLSRRLLPPMQHGATPAWSWSLAALEAIFLCALAFALSCWIVPQDPLGLNQQFPWLWIVPVLLAMRYGTAIGVTAVVTFICFYLLLATLAQWMPWSAAVVASAASLKQLEFPKVFFLGGLVLTLVCGQFSDIWSARTRRLRAVNAYLDERLNTLTNNHFLLRLSHERLEQDLLAKPLTLRETLARLRQLTASQDQNNVVALPGASEFMQLLGQSCQLEIAALYEVTGAERFASMPVALLGEPGALDQSDPLVRYCLAQGRLAHVQTTDIAPAARSASRYLICAPLVPSGSAPVGLLVVEKLPFFALNDDALQLLSVLIGYYADGVRLGHAARSVLEKVPDCPPAMALDLMRLQRIRSEAGIETSLVALVFGKDEQSLDRFEQVKRLKRGVDLSWELAGSTHVALITLLPLASVAAVDGYLLRIESALQQQFGGGFVSSQITTHVARLSHADAADTLLGLVRRCAV
jgi:hypothetical protein